MFFALVASGGGGGSAAVVQLGILLLIPLAMYFLMIRPQRRRTREQAQLQSALKVGNEVIMTSGIYGIISGEVDDNTFWLEIDEDVQVKVARAAIQGIAPGSKSDSDDADAEDSDDVDEADEFDDAESAD